MLKPPMPITGILHHADTVSPTVNDDQTQGFDYNSHWINTTTNELFVCFSPSTGAAVWQEVGAGAAGGVHVDTRDPISTDDSSVGFQVGSLWLNKTTKELWTSVDGTPSAAVWRDTTEFAHLTQWTAYVVGPKELARFQTIQSAIDQAKTDGGSYPHIYILPGTYTEDLTIDGFTDTLTFVEVEPRVDPNLPDGLSKPSTDITGKITLEPSVDNLSVFFYGMLNITGKSGSPVFDLNPSAYANNLDLYIGGGRVVSLSGQPIFQYTSTIAKFVIVTCSKSALAAGYPYPYDAQVAALGFSGGFDGFFADRCQIQGDLTGVVKLISVSEGSLLNISMPSMGDSDVTRCEGQIHVTSGVTTMGVVDLRGSAFDVDAGVDHLVVDSPNAVVTLKEARDFTLHPIRVGGTDAGIVVEEPQVDEGTVWRYDSKRWGFVRNNYGATTDPTVNDDESESYAVGSEWLNTATGYLFKCTDATDGAAVWGVAGAIVPSRDNQNMAALTTTTDEDLACATAIAHTPVGDGLVEVRVNGHTVHAGDGSKVADCYFSGDGGTNVRNMADVQLGDYLYWMGSIAGHELDSTKDKISFVYSA